MMINDDENNIHSSNSFYFDEADIDFLKSNNRNLLTAYRELFALYRLSQQLGSLKDVSSLPAMTFRQAGRILHYYSAILLLTDESPGKFISKYDSGEQLPVPSVLEDPDSDFAGWLSEQGKPILMESEFTTPSGGSLTDVFVPLSAMGQIVGVLILRTDLSESQVTQHQLALLSILASQIAVSLDNSRLYANLTRKNEKLLSLSGDLEQSREQLRSFNEELERKVRKRTEALEDANRKLKELDRVKTDFLANMSHELKTPLNAIIGFSDVLLDGMDGELNEIQKEHVRKIRENGRHLFSMINQILDLSKLETGRMAIEITKFRIEDVIRASVSSIEPIAAGKNIRIEVFIPDDKLIVKADRSKVSAILNNLLGNAVKFTGEEGLIHVSVTRIDVEDKGGLIEVRVSDTGIGINKENLDIVFERFRQVDSSPSRKYGGTGLGLAIAREFVELHGGEISVESPSRDFPGKNGTTFIFTLPAAE